MLVEPLFFIGLFSYTSAKSGNEFVDAIVSHLRVSPFLVDSLNTTSYKGSFQVQDSIKMSNITAENLLNLKRVGDATINVDALGELHLKTSLALNDIVVRAYYDYQSWLNLNGKIGLKLPSLTMDIHATLGNLTSMTLRNFRVRDVSAPKVVDFSGTSSLFNWLGARRVEMFINQSTKLIVENIESFVHSGMTSVMTNERRCMPLRKYDSGVASELEWIDASGISEFRD
ncbi:uncharacterized protein LOC114828471 [Galendromus occidentalis]|uniref:Uncharacterized protein LOC114828471 n=1 Tax=Galendromus occidentalis TaxID=34638 RepID=A0AAJ7SIV5_9ACAR|nr:uncharacterized protein LOC114828471 [Galendromus occidentalis]